MGYAIPHQYEPQIQQIAQSQHITTAEAVDRVVRAGLERIGPTVISDDGKQAKIPEGELSEEEWQQLRAIPMFAFLENLPDSVANSIEAASEQARKETLTPRG
jgi:hypothetical protein